MKKNHVKVQKISTFIDGELLPAEREKISQHLVYCRKCQKIFYNLRRIVHSLRQGEKEIRPPAFLDQKILANVRSKMEEQTNTFFWGRLVKPGFRFMTAGLLALGIFLGASMGTKLTPLLLGEREETDITSFLSFEENTSSVADIALDFIHEGEPS